MIIHPESNQSGRVTHMRTAVIASSLLIVCRAVATADQFDPLTSRFSGISQTLRSATFGNGTYISVGDNGSIVSSSDSVTWIPRASGTSNRLNSVTYGQTGFVAVGEGVPALPSTILTSPDGIVWTKRSSPVTNELRGICY